MLTLLRFQFGYFPSVFFNGTLLTGLRPLKNAVGTEWVDKTIVISFSSCENLDSEPEPEPEAVSYRWSCYLGR